MAEVNPKKNSTYDHARQLCLPNSWILSSPLHARSPIVTGHELSNMDRGVKKGGESIRDVAPVTRSIKSRKCAAVRG